MYDKCLRFAYSFLFLRVVYFLRCVLFIFVEGFFLYRGLFFFDHPVTLPAVLLLLFFASFTLLVSCVLIDGVDVCLWVMIMVLCSVVYSTYLV